MASMNIIMSTNTHAHKALRSEGALLAATGHNSSSSSSSSRHSLALADRPQLTAVIG